jgi:hypothetical protein
VIKGLYSPGLAPEFGSRACPGVNTIYLINSCCGFNNLLVLCKNEWVNLWNIPCPYEEKETKLQCRVQGQGSHRSAERVDKPFKLTAKGHFLSNRILINGGLFKKSLWSLCTPLWTLWLIHKKPNHNEHEEGTKHTKKGKYHTLYFLVNPVISEFRSYFKTPACGRQGG